MKGISPHIVPSLRGLERLRVYGLFVPPVEPDHVQVELFPIVLPVHGFPAGVNVFPAYQVIGRHQLLLDYRLARRREAIVDR